MDSHYKDEVVVMASCFYNGDTYREKTTSLYNKGPFWSTGNMMWSARIMVLTFYGVKCRSNSTAILVNVAYNKIPHISPWWVSFGVFVVYFYKHDRMITRAVSMMVVWRSLVTYVSAYYNTITMFYYRNERTRCRRHCSICVHITHLINMYISHLAWGYWEIG